MIPPPPGGCGQAAQLLRSENADAINAFLDHLPLCLACQAFVAQHEKRFQEIFERDPIDQHLPAIQDALERLNRVEFRLPEKPREKWEAPTFPGYELLEKLNETRHSKVFLARQTSLNRQVALKCVRLRETAGDIGNLAREAAVLAGLNHPNILTIFETGTWDKGIWLALEYCGGGSLADRLEKVWPARTAARLIRSIAQGLHTAHLQGVIHRDIKPANILFTKDGQPKLGDFGLADGSSQVMEVKQGAVPGGSNPSLTVIGTPSYIAPEQVKAQVCDNRVDVHGLGAVLYHLLTGQPPFMADNAFKALNMAANEMPVPPAELNPEVPEDLNAICMKCLSKDPAGRYDTARDLARDLGNFMEGVPVQARPLGKVERVWKWARRNRGLAAALAGVLVLLVASAVGFAGLSFWAMGEKREAEEAKKRADDNAMRALRQKLLAQYHQYVNQIRGVLYEWEGGSTQLAKDLLEACPFLFRGWEHHFETTKTQKDQIDLVRFTKEAECARVSPDGKFFAFSSEDGTVRLLDALTGETVLESDFKGPLRGIAFSGNGEWMAVASKARNVYLCNVRTKKWEKTISLAKSNLSNMYFGWTFFLSDAGDQLYIENGDAEIGVWNTKTLQLENTIPVPDKNPIISISAFSGMNRSLALIPRNGGVHFFDLNNSKPIAKFEVVASGINCSCFNLNGDTLFTGMADHTIRFIDAKTGKQKNQFQAHNDSINSLALSPDGKLLASAGDDNLIKIWDTRTLELLKTLRGHSGSIRSIHFGPEGRRLVSASWDKTCKVWDTSIQPATESRIGVADGKRVRALDVSAGGQNLLLGGDAQQVYLWNLEKRKISHRFPNQTDRVQALAINPDESAIAFGIGGPGLRGEPLPKITLHKITPPEESFSFDTTNESIQGLLFSKSGDLLFGAWNLGDLGIYSTKDGGLIKKWKAHDKATIGLALNSKGDLLATSGGDNLIKIWSTKDWSHQKTLIGHQEPIRAITFGFGDSILVSGCDDGSIRVWDLKTGKTSRILYGHAEGVTQLQFSPDGERLLSSSFDKNVRLWSTAWWEPAYSLPVHQSASRGAKFFDGGKRVASACDDGLVYLWDGTSPLDSQLIRGKKGELKEAYFIGAGDWILATDVNNEITLWEYKYGEEIENPQEILDLVVGEKKRKTSRGERFFLELRGRDVVLVDQELRKKRLERERKLLQEWAGEKMTEEQP